MDKFSVLVKILREKRGLTQAELAKKAGIGQGTVGDIERGARKCKVSTLDKISEVLKLTKEEKIKLDNAFMGRNLTNASNGIISEENLLITLPVRAKASAGNGCINLDDGEFLYSKTIRKNGFHDGCYLIEVVGDSMEPLIREGAFVVVDPRQTSYIGGKIYVVTYGDNTFIKKVVYDEASQIMVLKSINSNYDDIYIAGDVLESVTILGRAVKFVLEGEL